MPLRWVVRLFVMGLALAAAIGAAAEEARVSGSASYRERIALPPGAVFEAVLEDVSLADAPAVEIGRVTVEEPGAPPFAFEIPYDPAAIEPRNRYAVRARVTADGSLLFISDTAQPVLTGGAPDAVEIEMQRTAAPAGDAAGPAIGAHGLLLPATFAGDLPCADCEALRFTLNLAPDQAFFLRRAWVGKDFQQDRIGRWSVDPERRVLTLDDGDEPMAFEILGPDRLRLLGRDGAPIVSELNYELAAADEVEPMELHLPLRGMVTYLGDAARFTECLTGRDYPLATEDDYAELEHAYLAAGADPGRPLMASFDGAIAERPPAEGDGSEPAVLVERFIGVWPGETCERNMTNASLINTYWKILRLGAAEIAAGEGRREPNLVLRPHEARFNATVGCNQFLGGYALAGERLSFGPAAATRMACPPPLDAWERLLGDTLAAARSWRIDGQALELFDENGAPVALFQAVYLP